MEFAGPVYHSLKPAGGFTAPPESPSCIRHDIHTTFYFQTSDSGEKISLFMGKLREVNRKLENSGKIMCRFLSKSQAHSTSYPGVISEPLFQSLSQKTTLAQRMDLRNLTG